MPRDRPSPRPFVRTTESVGFNYSSRGQRSDEGLIRPAAPPAIVYRMAHRLIKTLPAPVRRLWPSTVRNLVRQELRRLAFSDLITVEILFEELEFEMLVPSDAQYHWQDFDQNGCHEPMTTGALLYFLNAVKDPIVWDVGSYCGYFGKVALEATDCNAVHIIEPNGAHVGAIRANLDGQPETVIHPEVLTSTRTAGMTGDDLAAEYRTPNIIKIDVDGGEGEILKGMKQVLATQPYLLVELHYLDSYESIRKMVINKLNPLPYDWYFCKRQRDPNGDWRHLDSLYDLPANPPEELNDSMLAALPADDSVESFSP